MRHDHFHGNLHIRYNVLEVEHHRSPGKTEEVAEPKRNDDGEQEARKDEDDIDEEALEQLGVGHSYHSLVETYQTVRRIFIISYSLRDGQKTQLSHIESNCTFKRL